MSDVRGRHLPFRCLLPTDLTLLQMKSKQAQLQLIGSIGSLSAFCAGKTSAQAAHTHLLLQVLGSETFQRGAFSSRRVSAL